MVAPISDKKAMANLAANIRRLRGHETLQRLADASSTPDWRCYAATIADIERKKHLPRGGVIARLACGLRLLVGREVTIDELFAEPPKRKRPKPSLAATAAISV